MKENSKEKLPKEIEPEEPQVIDETIQNQETKTIAQFQTTIIKSTFPPPELLERYKQIDPSFPQRVLKMIEEEQKHRHKIIERGQKFALSIAIGGLLTTLVLGIWGNPWVAGMIGFTSLATLVGAFLESKKQEKGF